MKNKEVNRISEEELRVIVENFLKNREKIKIFVNEELESIKSPIRERMRKEEILA